MIHKIRPAGPADAAGIRSLLSAVHFDTHGLDPSCFVVAHTPRGVMIGCAQIKPIGRKRVLSSVVVSPDFQHEGVGAGMVRSLLESETGSVILMCRGDLIPYYQTFGFQRVMARSAPFGLYWKWAVLSLLSVLRRESSRPAVMVRQPQPIEKRT